MAKYGETKVAFFRYYLLIFNNIAENSVLLCPEGSEKPVRNKFVVS